MRIALVSNNYTPYSGGLVSALNVLAPSLINRGHAVCLIVPDFGVAQEKDPSYVIRLPCPIKFTYKKAHIALSWRYHRDILEIIRDFDADIVHVHHPFLLGIAGRNAARVVGKPVVFTYHTCYEAYSHYLPLPMATSRYVVSKLVQRFCKSVDGIIAPSTAILHTLQRQNSHMIVKKIPTAIQDIFLQNKGTMKRRAAHDSFSLLYVGRFTKEKNIEMLLQMFAKLDKRFRLQLVGYGALYEPLRKVAYDTLSLSTDHVQFFHRPLHHTIARLYGNADLFLFPSLYDTQGLVLAEAMAGGTPVVALDGPGQRDIISDGYNGYIVHSEKEMLVKIIHIADNPKFHRQLQQGAWYTSREYHPRAYSNKTLAFYRQILSGNKSLQSF